MPAAARPPTPAAAPPAPAATPTPAAAAPAVSVGAQTAGAQTDFSGVHAGPSVRRIAREMGVDLTKLTGTGEKGRISKDDIMAFLRGPAPAPAGAPAAAAAAGIPEITAQDFAKFSPIETKPLSLIKRLSGPFLHRSWLNVPHVTRPRRFKGLARRFAGTLRNHPAQVSSCPLFAGGRCPTLTTCRIDTISDVPSSFKTASRP